MQRVPPRRHRPLAGSRIDLALTLGGRSFAPGSRGAGRPPLPRRLRLFLILGTVLVVTLGIGWLWLSNSSLLAVRTVSVSGLSGPNAGTMRARLIATAKQMTTLNLSESKLEQAIGDFPYVQSVEVSAHYPHGVSITVNETVPIARVQTAAGTVIVDTDGKVLNSSVTVANALPTLKATSLPSGKFLTESDTIAAVRLLSAAPYALIAHVQTVTYSAANGLTVRLRNGPVVYFGDAADPAAQWQAAVGVLANSASQGANYIDVTNPNRPATG